MCGEREYAGEDSGGDCRGFSHECRGIAPPSAHIVVERFAAALALHVHEHALGGAELLVETHHVVHAGERLAVDVLDHVTRAKAELLVQASRLPSCCCNCRRSTT